MSALSLSRYMTVQWRSLLFILAAIIFSYTIFTTLIRVDYDFKGPISASAGSWRPGYGTTGLHQELVKPPGLKVIAIVFYGRRDRSQILHCFLMRNLVDHGGWLDEVHWIRNTDDQQDLDYLDQLLTYSNRYKQLFQERTKEQGYSDAWSKLQPGHIYVKIDDDVVWMADDAIPRIVTTKIQHPEYLLVSANMINSPLMGWLHYRAGAVHPYLPEMSPEDPSETTIKQNQSYEGDIQRASWKHVDHPLWQGPDGFVFAYHQKPPRDGHRWLRLPETPASTAQLRRTPVVDTTYDTWGAGLQSWAIAAQHHYSFLENLYNGDLQVYKFAAGAKPWITDWDRLSINFIAINSSEILSHLPIPAGVVDEEWLTVTLPRSIGKSVAVDTQSVAAHLSFFFQSEVSSTDLLGRYLDYAEENVCRKV
ncbi:hypothetical protein LTR10_016890 [Elasticomyces elasticus]|uniref:Glycosyl transferase 64 domain-containing protein n=1 Tax=Exophiala sideris TaxID=1016849 RepID=A0ABR0JJV3_9EURO|nr:hypothetical protein LTR10_016890 [Elasticomyces elasticus]KAK5035341.1 hypothetical protein LTS07_002777 [Exophiala sideris]KAK5039308.1 hypothetical protein LTR13_003565 [Exophiala sideris]KAK5066265.1 hypothetical protein LTR69_002783 [Exophiala sideris]KAK5186942.1 hypothetical protein LTR44_000948 [Eurotiomycetes sp. CCFEE 6388]